MTPTDATADRKDNLSREINALLGLLEFSRSRHFPSSISAALSQWMQSRDRELKKISGSGK